MSSYNELRNDLFCKYCGKQCKNLNSLSNHERTCPNNKDRKYISYTIGIKAWNKGLTKDSDDRVAKYVHTRKVNYELGLHKDMSGEYNPATKSENKKKISDSVNKRVKDGTWHTSLAKNMHYNYNGIDLHGTWELKYAQYLDENKVQWRRPKERFKYIFEDKERYYTPDFYLVDSDTYIEIKGYKTKKDEAKWNQFTGNLKVLFKDDLINLGICLK